MDTSPELPMHPLASLIRHEPPLHPDEPLAAAATRVAGAGGGLPVADASGRLIGYLANKDLLGALFPAYLSEFRNTAFLTRDFPAMLRHARQGAATTVGEHMSRDPAYVHDDDSESHAAELFLHTGFGSLAVVDANHHVIGVLRLADLIQAVLEGCEPGP